MHVQCGSILRHVIPPVCIFYMQTQNEPLWLAGWVAIYIEGNRKTTVGYVYSERDAGPCCERGPVSRANNQLDPERTAACPASASSIFRRRSS
jgi:hypothetical protein